MPAPGLVWPKVSGSVSQLIGIRPTAPEPPRAAFFIITSASAGLIRPVARRTVSQFIRVGPLEPPGRGGRIPVAAPLRLRRPPTVGAGPVCLLSRIGPPAPGLGRSAAVRPVSLVISLTPTPPRVPGPARLVNGATRRSGPVGRLIRLDAARPAPTTGHIPRITGHVTRITGHVTRIRHIRRRPLAQVRPKSGRPARWAVGVRPRASPALVGVTPARILGCLRLTRGNVTRIGGPATALATAAARIWPAGVMSPGGTRLGRPGIGPVPIPPALLAPASVFSLRLRLRIGRPSPTPPAPGRLGLGPVIGRCLRLTRGLA